MTEASIGRWFKVLSGQPSSAQLAAELPNKREYLHKIDIFQDLTADEIHALDEMTTMTTMPKGRVIYRQEDSAEALFLLKKGRVRLSRFSPNGKKLEFATLAPGTFFGEMPMLGERMRNAQAEALDDCTLCVMSAADIERMVADKPKIALRMLETLGRRLTDAEARLEDLAYRSVPARLAALLLRLSVAPGGAIEGLTHQELGDAVGAYRETITKTLDEFQERGLVELGRRRLRIVDRAGLAAVLDEE
ncbi:MAG TPA: Crp/Fnr family transcriptional regulator [Chloroflexota bacterium]|nr:Crp/Fnr family transcriptional regulator [Chloroflexota bacterium]